MDLLLNSQIISESKREEAIHDDSERRCREILDLLPEIVFEFDSKWNLTYANRRATELLGYTSEEVLGKNVLDIVKHDERKRASRKMEAVLKGGKCIGDRYNFRKKDGIVYGFYLTPEQQDKIPHGTPIDNVFIASNWTQVSHGVGTCQINGWMAARLIMDIEGIE